MTVKLLTEYQLEFLSLKGGCAGSAESTVVKVQHCWKSHVTAQIFLSLSRASANLKEVKIVCFWFDAYRIFKLLMMAYMYPKAVNPV